MLNVMEYIYIPLYLKDMKCKKNICVIFVLYCIIFDIKENLKFSNGCQNGLLVILVLKLKTIHPA